MGSDGRSGIRCDEGYYTVEERMASIDSKSLTQFEDGTEATSRADGCPPPGAIRIHLD